MNLPQVHERVLISQEAEGEFSVRIFKEVFEEYKPRLDESINVFSQSIINLSREEKEKVFINDSHKRLEDILEEVSEKYSLTYGEKVRILTSKIQSDAKYVIRWERHKDLSKEGDWA